MAIFLDQEYHGAGIGTRLTETILSYGQQRGLRRVWLLVERNNLPAVSLYQHVGFTLSKALGYDVEMEIFL
jgi:ribosomal protein S18 acetylase RimI-like enzyme